jgi:rubredoxin
VTGRKHLFGTAHRLRAGRTKNGVSVQTLLPPQHVDHARQTHLIKRRMLMDKYECPCGYVYDPELGDPENGIAPGTPFDKLPEDWVCPKCGAEKQYFEKV